MEQRNDLREILLVSLCPLVLLYWVETNGNDMLETAHIEFIQLGGGRHQGKGNFILSVF